MRIVCFGDVPWEPRTEDDWPCLVKRLVVDDERGVAVRAVWYARDAVEPRHVHDGSHAAVVLVGTAVVDGRALGPGDVIYGPGGEPHGPLHYPHGCMLFALIAGGALHTAVAGGDGSGAALVAEADVPWQGGRKLLVDDPGRGYRCALERHDAGAARPPGTGDGACATLVLSGRAEAQGETLGPWDLVYGATPELTFTAPCLLAVTTAGSRIAALA